MTSKDTVKSQRIRSVYGRMVDPHTGCTFDLAGGELLKMTPWVQSQIEAGKLLLQGEFPSKPPSVPEPEVPVKLS